MKVVIIGGVAAGTKVAAKLKREDRSIEVLLITKSKDISYAGCGLPYYVGNVIEDRGQLIVNTPKSFAALTGADIITETEAIAVDRENKRITARNLNITGPLHDHRDPDLLQFFFHLRVMKKHGIFNSKTALL